MTTPVSEPLAAPTTPPASRPDSRPLDLLPIVTLVLWLVPLGVGVTGCVLGYPSPPRESPPPLLANTQLVNVEVPKTPLPAEPEHPPPPAATPDLTAIPQAPAPAAAPQAPALAVALPTPAIAFAVPVEGLTRIVDAEHAVYQGGTSGTGGAGGGAAAPAPPPKPSAPEPAAIAAPPVMQLTMGQGEGDQPAPDYPREAIVARQQGTVRLRFNVDETGRVTHLDIIGPSRFSLLNQAAARTVRERWHFPPGPPRIFEVPIQFQLSE